jgi:hypothetical protein
VVSRLRRRLIRRIAKQLHHCRIRHAGERRGTGLQAVKPVEDAGFAEAFDQIDSFKAAGEIGGRLRRYHAQVWDSLGIVHLGTQNVEFRPPESQQIGLWRSRLGSVGHERRRWREKTFQASLASLPRVFFAKRLSGSVVDACVSLERRSPWKFTVELPRARDGVTP